MSDGNKIKIEIPEKIYIFNELRKPFVKIAKNNSELFYDDYHTNFNDMDDLIQNGFSTGLKYLEEAFNYALKQIIDNLKLYELDLDSFVEKYAANYLYYKFDLQEINNYYEEIILGKEEAKERRRERVNRSRYRTVTVKSSGNRVDVNETEDVNAAVAIGAFFGNLKSSYVANKQTKASFRDAREVLKKSIYKTCLNMHFAVIDAFNENTNKNLIDYDTLQAMQDKSQKILNNITKGIIPKEELHDIVLKLFLLAPYNINSYKTLINYGMDQGEINVLADNFDVDVSVLTFGKLLELKDGIVAKIKGADFVTQKQIVLNTIIELEKLANDQRISVNNPKYIEMQREIIMVFISIDNSKDSEKEKFAGILEVQKLYSEVDFSKENKDLINNYKEKLLSYSNILFNTIEEKNEAIINDLLKGKIIKKNFWTKRGVFKYIDTQIKKMSSDQMKGKYSKAVAEAKNKSYANYYKKNIIISVILAGTLMLYSLWLGLNSIAVFFTIMFFYVPILLIIFASIANKRVKKDMITLIEKMKLNDKSS